MPITIDSSGRLVIPKKLRQEAGLLPGVALEIRVADGRVEIEPLPERVTLRRAGRLTVAERVGGASGATLSAGTVRKTLAAVRRSR